MSKKTAFVSGCFDLLHSGHIEFFEQAASYGDLIVALGSDQTVYGLKGRPPVNSQQERLFMVKALACVHDALISSGSGYMDFEQDLVRIQPDYFVVNVDGDTLDKRKLCKNMGIEYVVLERKPHTGLQPRSTTALRGLERMPYRIDIAGGWLDQPFVSKHHPGSVITLSLEPTLGFNKRSGMATSTRRTAIELWGNRLPVGDPHEAAWVLFCCDNPPGTVEISGAQDTIGLVFAGLARSDYDGDYWPHHIEHITHEATLSFVENLIYLIPLGPRHRGFNVLSGTHIDAQGAQALAEATNACWQAILDRDAEAFGQAFRHSFEAQIAMFPNMVTPTLFDLIDSYRDIALGWKVSGAGGGGYLILVSEQEIEQGIRCVVRRASE